MNPRVELNLDPTILARIVDAAVVASSKIVNFHFNALSILDLSKPVEPVDAIYRFRGPELNAAQRRVMHENWVLAKAFQELLRAVRHALEEAHVLTALLTRTHTVRSNITLLEFLQPFRSKAQSLSFPTLLADVNKRLDPKLEFADSYRSLQSARNCLEHRNGIVSKVETHGGDKFELSVPRMKIFYMRGGVEIEIEKGSKIDPGDNRQSVDVIMKLEARRRSIALGERLSFTLSEFNEIAFACHFLGQQLSTKFPSPAIAKAEK